MAQPTLDATHNTALLCQLVDALNTLIAGMPADVAALSANVALLVTAAQANLFEAPVTITRNADGTIDTMEGGRNGDTVTRTYSYSSGLCTGWTEVII